MNRVREKNKTIDIFIEKIKDIKTGRNEKWAIYGTGDGAEFIYEVICEAQEKDSIQYIIDRDDKAEIEPVFHEIPIRKLSEVCEKIDGIIIAAIDHHEIIKKRIFNTLTDKQLAQIRIIDIFTYNTVKEKLEYIDYIEKRVLKDKTEFVEFDNQGYKRKEKDTKIIAWYLPQYHQLEINNKFHGQGFTEWTNTSNAMPMFAGHYQPHIPYDVGYYDLLNIDTLKRQIYLAKHYGIYGFCFHYYWFSGKRIMEKPLELLLQHKELDIPFCLDWANENWTALWDGGNKEIMMKQELAAQDDQKFMEDILPYMSDPRYIKINGRPILVIYRIKIFEKERVKVLLHNFREIARKNGFPDLYIMLTNSFRFNEDVREWGADALVEFPPHVVSDLMDDYRPAGYLNPYFDGKIYDAAQFIEKRKYMLEHGEQPYFRAALSSWDTTARKATSRGMIMPNLSPDTFKKWLSDIIDESKRIHSKEEDIVFVNSWNEWAEGSHLEPDMKYGYAWLQKIKETLEESAVQV